MSESFLQAVAQTRADAISSTPRHTASHASPLGALERSMGLTAISSPFSPGEISDMDETPPGRSAVQYGSGQDALFDSPVVSNAILDAMDENGPEGDDDPSSSVANLFGSIDASMLGPGGDPSALLAQLEAVANEFERQSGEPETEIRGQIALLRSVLDARPAAIAQSRSRMGAALQAIDAQQHDPAAAEALAERAAQTLCADRLASIEANMDAVGSTLRDDPATASVVAQMLTATKSK